VRQDGRRAPTYWRCKVQLKLSLWLTTHYAVETSLLLKYHAMKTCCAHTFLTSAQVGGAVDAYPRERAPGTYWMGRCGGLRTSLDAMAPAWNRFPVIQPVTQSLFWMDYPGRWNSVFEVEPTTICDCRHVKLKLRQWTLPNNLHGMTLRYRMLPQAWFRCGVTCSMVVTFAAHQM
jgi:hypothetical protein